MNEEDPRITEMRKKLIKHFGTKDGTTNLKFELDDITLICVEKKRHDNE